MADSLITSLVKPVVAALARAGCTPEGILTGPVVHTDLPWQAPPLMTEAPLGGLPLSLLLERHFQVNVQRLYSFWDEALTGLRNSPRRVFKEDEQIYRQLSYVLPRATMGERRLLFSTPEGFPAVGSDYTGAILSIECAHVLRVCTPVQQVVEDEDNYYVVTEEGHYVGIKDGLPLLHANVWDLPLNGMVHDLMRMPRGSVFHGCDYDLVAKVRSAIWENKDQIPEFEGCDLAMQALRILANGTHVRELLTHVQRIKIEKRRAVHRLGQLEEAQQIANLPSISDRMRIKAIRSLLVPEVMTTTEFVKNIYHCNGPTPATIMPKALQKLRDGIQKMIDEERK